MLGLFRPLVSNIKLANFHKVPQGYFATIRKYTKEHEWVKYDDVTQIGEIGITDHAQSELGDIVHLDTNEPGTKVTIGQTIGSIESVKSTSDIYSPVTGQIKEVNKEVVKDCAVINKDAENSWIYKIKLNTASEINQLMSKEEYEKYLKH